MGAGNWSPRKIHASPKSNSVGKVLTKRARTALTEQVNGAECGIASLSRYFLAFSISQYSRVSPANTAIFPWVAAYNGTVDVVYYATTAASKDDPTAVWNVYLAQTINDGANFAQSLVSNTPNHVGVICTNGTGCAPGTRNLLDLFEVGINPQNARAAVIYTDDTITTTSEGDPLPQIVLAQQN